MRYGILAGVCAAAFLLVGFAPRIAVEERTQTFDKDPGWDGQNNRSTAFPIRTIRQDFGYSPTARAGGAVGEMGGFITPAAEPAYYAKKIPTKTFNDRLSASGTVVCKGPRFHLVIGFFNAGTLNEWRTPNTVSLRLSARGDFFYAWLEYATRKWRAGGDNPQGFTVRDPQTGKQTQIELPGGERVYRWTLEYDPNGNNGNGVVTATLNGKQAICHLDPGHKAEGGTFNRFGLLPVMKQWDDGGEVWLDNVTINGEKEDFGKDPRWEGFQNRRTYMSSNVRPRFDFGYSPTRHAGGKAAGELGGLIFRGDCRYPERMACYGDRLSPLTLDKPLRARGKISLRRGVSDSTTLFGFYHSTDSMTVIPSQANGLPACFLGACIEGPSSEGFYLYPAYGARGDGRGVAVIRNSPRIPPDGKSRDWTLEYDPNAAEGKGRITVTLDGQSIALELSAEHRAAGARFDRFGLVTTWIDGNGQHVYFDDLTYTCRQE